MKPFSEAQLVPALNEWMRRYIEEPERFQAEMRTVALFNAEEAAGREPSYGQESAAYLDQIRSDLASQAKAEPTGVSAGLASTMASLAAKGAAPRRKPKRRKAKR